MKNFNFETDEGLIVVLIVGVVHSLGIMNQTFVFFSPAKHQRFVTLATTISAMTTKAKRQTMEIAMIEMMPSPEPTNQQEKC